MQSPKFEEAALMGRERRHIPVSMFLVSMVRAQWWAGGARAVVLELHLQEVSMFPARLGF